MASSQHGTPRRVCCHNQSLQGHPCIFVHRSTQDSEDCCQRGGPSVLSQRKKNVPPTMWYRPTAPTPDLQIANLRPRATIKWYILRAFAQRGAVIRARGSARLLAEGSSHDAGSRTLGESARNRSCPSIVGSTKKRDHCSLRDHQQHDQENEFRMECALPKARLHDVCVQNQFRTSRLVCRASIQL